MKYFLETFAQNSANDHLLRNYLTPLASSSLPTFLSVATRCLEDET